MRGTGTTRAKTTPGRPRAQDPAFRGDPRGGRHPGGTPEGFGRRNPRRRVARARRSRSAHSRGPWPWPPRPRGRPSRKQGTSSSCPSIRRTVVPRQVGSSRPSSGAKAMRSTSRGIRDQRPRVGAEGDVDEQPAVRVRDRDRVEHAEPLHARRAQGDLLLRLAERPSPTGPRPTPAVPPGAIPGRGARAGPSAAASAGTPSRPRARRRRPAQRRRAGAHRARRAPAAPRRRGVIGPCAASPSKPGSAMARRRSSGPRIGAACSPSTYPDRRSPAGATPGTVRDGYRARASPRT